MQTLRFFGWIACVVYSTIPAFWLLIHPRAEYWRSRQRSPYRILVPLWIGMWAAVAAITYRWRDVPAYENNWTWILAAALFGVGELLLRSAAVGIGLLIVSAVAAAAIARNLDSATERALAS